MADEQTEKEKKPFDVAQEALSAAIIKLNSMCPDDGVIMTKEGTICTGNESDENFLCMLIPAGKLARQLTADGLASYSGKELKKWADGYDRAPLQQIVDAARG